MGAVIMILGNCLKHITTALLFPKNKLWENPGKLFYVKYVLFYLTTIGVSVGSSSNLMKTIIREHTYINTDVDISLVASLTGCNNINAYFVFKVELTLKLHRPFNDIRSNDIPKDLDTENRRLNELSFVHCFYISIAVLSIASAPLLEKGSTVHILDGPFPGCLFGYLVLVAAVLGWVDYRLVKIFSLMDICMYVGWMDTKIMSTVIIGKAIYNFKWSNLECAS